MGHPKKQRKKYESPRKLWDKSRIEKDKKTLDEFGLRRKRELWRFESILREFRRRARELQAKRDETREKDLFEKLSGMGIRCTSLDDVLSINLENILSRRLQTIVYKKGIANSPMHARQLIVHGHVAIKDRKISWPSYIVKRSEEDAISLRPEIAAKMIRAESASVKDGNKAVKVK